MTIRLKTGFVILLTVFSLTACKLVLEVPKGGAVESSSGQFNCSGGQRCEVDIPNGEAFNETFTAIPDPDHQLVGWGPSVKGSKASLCSGTKKPCKVALTEAFTKFSLDAYLLPIFEKKEAWNYWQHEDVKVLDDWGENTNEHSDLIALYHKSEPDHLVLRIDYMNLTSASVAPTFFGLDFKTGGTQQVTQDNQGLELDLTWDVLIVAEGGDITAYDSSFNELSGSLSGLVIDRHVDYLSVKVAKSALAGWSGGEMSLQALTSNGAKTTLVDKTAVAGSEDKTDRGKLVIALNTAVTPRYPYNVSEYDGFDFAFAGDRPGVRRGYRYVMDAAQKYRIPIAWTDIRIDTLGGFEYLRLNEQFRRMNQAGLLDLFGNTYYGQFMTWWPDHANQVAIDLTKAAKRKMGIPESGVFYPYESMVRVRDLALIKNSGYKALYAIGSYDNWFCCGPDSSAPETIPEYSAIGRKIHRVNGLDVIFDPQGFGQNGFVIDGRWTDQGEGRPSGWADLTRGTDRGLHRYYRRTLLDLAIDPDQEQFTQAGGDDVGYTEWIYADVADWNFEWLASHPWIEVTSHADLLSRGWDVVDLGTLDLAPDDTLRQHPREGDGNYNSYFNDHYYGGPSDGHSPLVPAGVQIESLYDYVPYLRDGQRIPSGRIIGDYKTPGTIVYETLNNLRLAPDNALRELAWLNFFQQTGEITFHWEENLLPRSKVQANFVGHTNKITAAAVWADATARGEYSRQSIARAEDLDFDGEDEYILHNDQLFAVFENDGGRLEYAFAWSADAGPIQLIAPELQRKRPFAQGNRLTSEFYKEGENLASGGREAFFDGSSDTGERYTSQMTAEISGNALLFESPDGTINKRFTLSEDVVNASYAVSGLDSVSVQFCFVTNLAILLENDWPTKIEPINSSRATGWQTSAGGYAAVNQGNSGGYSFLDSPAADEMSGREDTSAYPTGHYQLFPWGCTGIASEESNFDVSITLRANSDIMQ